MLDLLIRGGTVFDGTGAPGARADVGVRDGRVEAVGRVDEPATRTIDATGLYVTPGFVDPHTHYDAQLFWDPVASPSNLHGVTSIVAGNCGFTLAPVARAEDAEYLRRMMVKVEGMPLAALENGVPWNWSSFGDYLDRLDGNIAVNAGFMVGHCALRRKIMGADAVGSQASDEQLDAMARLLHECIDAGGIGLSSTMARTHSDGDGNPVPSRFATRDEVLTLCAATGEHEGTGLEVIINGCLDGFSDDDVEFLVAMSTTARRPLNWNVLTVDSRKPGMVEQQLLPSTRAAEAGGKIMALTMPILVPMNMSFGTYCALNLLPGWGEILSLPVPERIEKLRDPEVRRMMDERAHSKEAGVVGRLASWRRYEIGDTFSTSNEGLKGRSVGEIAAERHVEPFDALLDVVIADDLRTVLWPIPTDGDEASWALRAKVWQDDRVLLGGSDAGAHLDRMCGAPYPTSFLGDCLRGRKLVPVEQAVRMLTDDPARLFGLRDRGRLAAGMHADVVVFDPDTIDATPARLVDDLPGESKRLFADAHGVQHVLVNGVETITGGRATGALPGAVLRSGRDTYTPEL